MGVFPFGAGTGARGYLRVVLARPLFEGIEVAFLRFVASLAGVLLASAPSPLPAPLPLEQGGDGANESAARRYVAMAVHDLRNPLNVLAGYGSLLADGTLGPLGTEQKEAVDAINRQLGSILGLIDRLIDFDRLARAESTVNACRFNVRELFDEIRRRCFDDAGPNISWPDAEAGFDFVTDRRRLFAIVQNLVDNAIKHAQGSSVTVCCSRTDGRLLVSVADAGPGLPPALKAALGDRDACERLRERGDGLGLYTAACYVKMLGGRLEAHAPEGGGTEFRVSLPALTAQAAEVAA